MTATDSTALAISSPNSVDVQSLLVGNWQPAEFSRAIAQVRASAKLDTIAASINEACERLQSATLPPELIFIAQHLPGDLTQFDIDLLQAAAPLARIVVVAGSWCEGELRTGSPPTGVIRLYWYEVSPWWQAALRRYRAGQCPLWSQPLDHAQAARRSAANDGLAVDRSTVEARLNVLVACHDYNVYETLTSSLAAYGLTTTWARNASEQEPYAAGIWDGGQLSPREQQQLATFCQQINGPVTALLDFPRREHFELAKQLGASSVFGKPYVVEEVVAEINDTVLPNSCN